MPKERKMCEDHNGSSKTASSQITCYIVLRSLGLLQFYDSILVREQYFLYYKVKAYSRMRIGKPVRQRADWTTNVEFPLLLTWYNRLRSHHFQTRVKDARHDLDIMDVDAVSSILDITIKHR